MNKKNIIMLSIAALLFANCAEGMEKLKPYKEKLVKIAYTTSTKEDFFTKLEKTQPDCSLCVDFYHDDDVTLTEGLNHFFETIAKLGHKVKTFTIMDSCNKDSPLGEINWEKAKYLESLTVGPAMLSAEAIYEILPQLKHLDLSGNKNICWADVSWKDAENLETLDLSNTEATTRNVDDIISLIPGLKSITAKNCKRLVLEKVYNPNKVKIIAMEKEKSSSKERLVNIKYDTWRKEDSLTKLEKVKKGSPLFVNFSHGYCNSKDTKTFAKEWDFFFDKIEELGYKIKGLRLHIALIHRSWDNVNWQRAKDLEWFDISDKRIPHTVISKIIVNIPKLKFLDLALSDILWKKIYWKEAKNMQVIDFTCTKISTKVVIKIIEVCPKITHINTVACKNVTEEDVKNRKNVKLGHAFPSNIPPISLID